MAEDLVGIQEQALVSILAAAKDQGVNLGHLYDRACVINEEAGSKIYSIDPRHTGEVALAISLALMKVNDN